MSVKRTLMAVHRTVETHQGHSGVTVIQAMSSATTVGLAKVNFSDTMYNFLNFIIMLF